MNLLTFLYSVKAKLSKFCLLFLSNYKTIYRKILWQLIKEFWLQFLLSICYALKISSYGADDEGNILLVFIKNFAACFFLLSWLFSQFIRVKRQYKLENNLITLLNKNETILNRIEQVYIDLEGFTTGGASFCYLQVKRVSQDYLVALVHVGKYPLFDINIRIRNLGEEDVHLPKEDQYFEIGTLTPEMVKTLNKINFVENKDGVIHYEIQIFSRNRSHTQFLFLEEIDNTWLTAINLLNGESIIFQEVPDLILQSPNYYFHNSK